MVMKAKKKLIEGGVKFSFVDGTELVAMLEDIPAEIVSRLAIHGLSQKIGDSYAGDLSVEESRAVAEGVLQNLTSGLWGVKVSRGGKIVEALSRVTGKSLEACLEKWNGMDKDAQKAIRKHADIKRVLAEMEAEHADAPDLKKLFK